MLSHLVIVALLATCWCLHIDEHQKSLLSYSQAHSAIHVRNATISDLDDITHVVLDAFASDSEYNYQFPFRKQYPRYHFECARQLFKEAFMNRPDSVVVKVIDVPAYDRNQKTHYAATVTEDDQSVGSSALSVGAVAIWDFNTTGSDPVTNAYQMFLALSTPSLTVGSKPDCAAHLDANATRVDSTTAQFRAIKQKYIDTAYDSQVYLALLATHPVWQNRGFGPANLAWGTTEASKLQIPVTLIATPAGYPVYVDTGFDSVANVTINRVEGDEGEGFWYEVMEWSSPPVLE